MSITFNTVYISLNSIVLVPLASHAVEVLTEEVQRETQGVLSNNKFQPQTTRDKMRFMFKQKEAQRKQSSTTRTKKTKKADDTGGKENSANLKVAKSRKKKGAKITPLVESNQDHEQSIDDELLAVNIGRQCVVRKRI